METITTAYPARVVARLAVAQGMRAERIVHQLDGIEHEVHPADVLSVGHQMWARWRAEQQFREHDVILGLDAGGILPTVAVALATSSPYRLAWKLNLDLPGKRVFHEPHARRAEVYTYGDLHGQRVLIIDDEVTTGQTLANLVVVLRDGGADAVGVLCLIEDSNGGGRTRLEALGVPLCALTTL